MNNREKCGHRLVLCPKAAARARRWAKRATARAERRDAKRFLEDAPPRHFRGWVD